LKLAGGRVHNTTDHLYVTLMFYFDVLKTSPARSGERLLEFDSSGASRIPPSATWDGQLSQSGGVVGGANIAANADPWSPKPSVGSSGLDPWGMPAAQSGAASIASSGFNDPWGAPAATAGED
jgi:hypothetical protein